MKKILLLLFVSALVFSSCKKDDYKGSLERWNSTMYWRANVDGDSIDLTEGKHYNHCADFIDSSETMAGVYTRPWTSMGNRSNLIMQDYIDLSFESKTFADFPTYAEFKTWFVSGPYAYCTVPGMMQQNGVRIQYYEQATNTMWYSYLGSQSGSTFTITGVDCAKMGADYYATIAAKFSCTLYDGLGNSKPVTNGLCVLRYICYRHH